MEYTDQQLRQAFMADEVARLMADNQNMFALTSSNRPSYGTAVADPELTLADLDDDTVDGAIAELAAERGVSATEVAEQVLMLTGGERDTQSRAIALGELARMDEDEAAALVGLAAKGTKAKKGKGWVDPDEEDETEDDEDEHLSEHQGNEGPKPKRSKRHKATAPIQVKKRGQFPFGSEGGAPEGGAGATGAGEGGAMAASAPRRALVRAGDGSLGTVALSEDEAWADAEIARLQQEHTRVGLSAPGETPSAWDAPGTTEYLGQHFPFEVHDVGARDDGDPSEADGGRTAAIIARLQKEHPGAFGLDKPQSGNRTISPQSVAARNAAERRELAGGRRQNPITR